MPFNNPSSGDQLADQALSQAKKNFDSNKKDIYYLLEIHEKMDKMDGRDGPCRRPEQVQVLHRAAIVMITACWQTYIEDLFRENFERLLSSFDDPGKIPGAIKEDIYNKNKNKRDYVWKFAGDGWKKILKEWSDEKLDQFNTPSNKKVDSLFKYLGLRNLSDCWS